MLSERGNIPNDIMNPLELNFRKQLNVLLEQLPQELTETFTIAVSQNAVLPTLSQLMLEPSITLKITYLFRPVLMDLCARWLDTEDQLLEKLEALGLLIECHEELYPILSKFLNAIQDSPLDTKKWHIDAEISSLHRILLAYYRILRATPSLPKNLGWDLSLLLNLLTSSHPDRGVRWLAVRCFSMQANLSESTRVDMERKFLGDNTLDECLIAYGRHPTGELVEVDGWMLPMLEIKRIREYRNDLLEPIDYYSEEGSDIKITNDYLSPNITNVFGILLLCNTQTSSYSSPLIPTPTTVSTLRSLAVNFSLRRPSLLTSSPASGKTILLEELSRRVYPNTSGQIVTIHLSDTSLDPRSLLGSYVSSPKNLGTFEWKDGALVKAMREGKWLVLKDIDKASSDVLSLINPLLESMSDISPIGERATLLVPGRGKVHAAETFSLFATRSVEYVDSIEPPRATFLGAHEWNEVILPDKPLAEIQLIIDSKFSGIAGCLSRSLIDIWLTVKQLYTSSSSRSIGFRDLEKFCSRVMSLLDSGYIPVTGDQLVPLEILIPHPAIREEIYFEAHAVFFAHGVTNKTALEQRERVAYVVGEKMSFSAETCNWILKKRTPHFEVAKNNDGQPVAVKAGRFLLPVEPLKSLDEVAYTRPFSLHKQAIRLLTHLSACVASSEPVLLTGETGTGKTSIISYLASLLHKPIVSLNLSNQTESSDLIGGFRPINARVPATELQNRFSELFQRTFSSKKNVRFQQSLKRAFTDGKWKAVVKLWVETSKMALDKLRGKEDKEDKLHDFASDSLDSSLPRKRQKRLSEKNSEVEWSTFEADVRAFETQHVLNKNQFSFDFEEGPLVKAIRTGKWVLLDEINLASAETLECISSLLQGPTASITLTEKGSFEPVPRHPGFRLFACMNPATDVGKRELQRNIRAKFTEIDVPPPDEDQEALIDVITHYIGRIAVADKSIIADIAQFYTSMKLLAEQGKLADGSDRRPHYSMRSLSRALTFAMDTVQIFGLRRAVWEGHIMTFTMTLDQASLDIVMDVAYSTLLRGVKNIPHFLSILPSPSSLIDSVVQFGPFRLGLGPNEQEEATEYILTPSVQKKLADLARIIMTRRYPILIEGPTSSGKTSAIQYLARRTGHNFVRINNHEHTDIQEYIGSYVSDANTGKLVFRDGLLVRALRRGDWIVLDELNLAPTDVLEALNRLLDDNRELVIPETQEVLKPHPNFMLFATQNPSGSYAGRKVLSRALRNRFLEVHFSDVPTAELEFILCQKSRIAPSYSQRIVATFRELQKRRQVGRVFEGKEGFATLRDLFRWAQRNAQGYQELAGNGYMLLAERVRNEDDKKVVKEVLESIMKVSISEEALYNIEAPDLCHENSGIVWTKPLKRLFILVSRALAFNEPVLLVGETGTGKTSVCQVYSGIKNQDLRTVNCHQNTEASDIIGGLRPVRLRDPLESSVVQKAKELLSLDTKDVNFLSDAIASRLSLKPPSNDKNILISAQEVIRSAKKLLEWQDGPLVTSMRLGGVFLLDEISLADDSVLERLNSVLEPARTLVLAEKGGDKVDDYQVIANPNFKFIATMNPGGDFGKKELSPALRNRFTEIWVPTMMKYEILHELVRSSWKNKILLDLTVPLLEFVAWFQDKVGDDSILSLRDVLSWVDFCNVLSLSSHLSPASLFVHGGEMTIVDGLPSLPQLSSWTGASIDALKLDIRSRLRGLVCDSCLPDSFEVARTHDAFHIGPFHVPLGTQSLENGSFSYDSQTSLQNAFRLLRACQLAKPILLEGSPGVGKTSLVSALATSAGQKLLRINLSEQTDLVDLFGSDLPLNGNSVGTFAWNDAEFLQALKNGHWVLLDEMNLASQSVLEGLNAVFDHRGTVYIPELDRSFTRHPNFRVFAAQNPINQGGGRKGLPRSFLNRFTKVYVEKLTADDIFLISRHYYPSINSDILKRMINFNELIHEEVVVKRSFGISGSPWEFNLRDIMRWAMLTSQSSESASGPWRFFYTIYGARFRTRMDRDSLQRIFMSSFGCEDVEARPQLRLITSPKRILCGSSELARGRDNTIITGARILPSQFESVEATLSAISNSWLVIVVGKQGSGKTNFVRSVASLSGRTLEELSLGGSSDISDLIGSFEQTSATFHIDAIFSCLLRVLDEIVSLVAHGDYELLATSIHLRKEAIKAYASGLVESLLELSKTTLSTISHLQLTQDLRNSIESSLTLLEGLTENYPQLEWVDGPLVKAMRSGDWLLLDNANMCSASVLDRLNSLCEVGGSLVLTEKGMNQEVIHPHQGFRLFMTVDPSHGEISRAMRNRGIEIALIGFQDKDKDTLRDASRIPLKAASGYLGRAEHGLIRRGIARSYEIATVKQQTPCYPDIFFTDSQSTYLVELQRLISSPHAHESLPLLLLEMSKCDCPDLILRLLKYLQLSSCTVYKVFLSLMQFDYFSLSKAVDGWKLNEFLHPYITYPYVTLAREADHGRFKTANVLFEIYFFAARIQDTFFYLKASRQATSDIAIGKGDEDMYEKLYQFIESLVSVSRQLLDKFSDYKDALRSTLTLNLKLLHITDYLSGFMNHDTPDFSTLMCTTQWLYDCLQEDSSSLANLSRQVEVIRNEYTLQTGLQLMNIWEALFPPTDAVKSNRLVARSLHLSGLCSEDKTTQSTEDLKSDSGRLASAATDLHTLLIDLKYVTSLKEDNSQSNLVNVTVSNSTAYTSRMSIGPELSFKGISELTQVHIAWLKSVWDISSLAKKDMSVLFSPLMLSSILTIDSSLRSGSINDISGFTKIYNTLSQQTVEQCSSTSTPEGLHVTFLLQATLILLYICNPQYRDFILEKKGCIRPSHDYRTSVISILQLESKVWGDLSELQAALQQVVVSKTWPELLNALGLSWITLSLSLLSLYVPNLPIDPIRIQGCKESFTLGRISWVKGYLKCHSDLEYIRTGDGSNMFVKDLQNRLSEVSETLPKTQALSRRGSPLEINAFWKEVRAFMKDVTSPARLHRFLTKQESNNIKTLVPQELLLQDSIANFLQRIKAAYTDLGDLVPALEMAFLQLRFGLRAMIQSAKIQSYSFNGVIITDLVGFPSVRGRNALRNLDPRDIIQPEFSHYDALLFRLEQIRDQITTNSFSEDVIVDIEETYEKAFIVWNVNVEKEMKKREESQSIYKSFTTESIEEEEDEDRKVSQMFPTFLDQDDISLYAANAELNSLKKPETMKGFGRELLDIHLDLFGIRHHAHDFKPRSKGTRKLKFVSSLKNGPLSMMSCNLDRDCLAFRLKYILASNARLHGETAGNAYSFYHDSNFLEAGKAAEVIKKLRANISNMINEWPDQLVLQHLRDRCDAILSINMASPVAKILSAVERLLLHTEDWEMFSNRQNSLEAHRKILTALIVEWRTLELRGWKSLLETEARTFCDDLGDWWFRLYEASIRGVVSAAQEASLDGYFESLVPLLEEFIKSSPLGQYKERLQMLLSFSSLALQFSRSDRCQMKSAMIRSSDILSSIYQYYDQFTAKIVKHLASQREKVEGDVENLVKLASWRDVNVYALQQSAQRTHKQLYRRIRKFRELLQQPILAHLLVEESPDVKANSLGIGASLSMLSNSPTGDEPHRVKKFAQILSSSCEVISKLPPLSLVEDLSKRIIFVQENILQQTPPGELTAPDRKKWASSLFHRKKRLWNDLLKELKDFGISANVKPEVLLRHRSRWRVMERPQIMLLESTVLGNSLERASCYYNRCIGLLSSLLISVENHHSDISTRELQRGISLFESLFSMAVTSRTSTVKWANLWTSFNVLTRRLHTLECSNEVIVVPNAQSMVSGITNMLGDTNCAVNELVDIGNDIFKLSGEMATLPSWTRLVDISSKCDRYKDKIASTLSSLGVSCVLTKDEVALIQETQDFFVEVKQSLADVSCTHPRLYHFSEDLQNWITQSLTTFCSLDTETPAGPGFNSESLMNVLLNVAQDVHTINSKLDTALQNPNLRQTVSAFSDIEKALYFEAVMQKFESFYEIYRGTDHYLIKNVTPFLTVYLTFIQGYLRILSVWNESLFKLTSDLGVLLLNVSSKGFCRPQEEDESQSDEGKMEPATEGTGLGEGKGVQDVNDQIEDESQLEGTSDQDDSKDEENRNGETDALDVNFDFGGDLEDVSDDLDEDSDENNDKSSDLDDEFDHNANGELKAIDEEFWDSKDDEDNNREEKEDDRSNGDDNNKSDAVSRAEESEEKADDKDGSDLCTHDDIHLEAELPDGEINESRTDDEIHDSNSDSDAGSHQGSPEPIDQLEDLGSENHDEDDAFGHPTDSETDFKETEETQEELQHSTEEEEEDGDRNGDDSIMKADVHEDPGNGDGIDPVGIDTSNDQDQKEQIKETDQMGSSSQGLPQIDSSNDSKLNSGADQGGNISTSSKLEQSKSITEILSKSQRVIGDSTKEILRRFDEIQDAMDVNNDEAQDQGGESSSRLEYVTDMAQRSEMQALGPAIDNERSTGEGLNFVDENDDDTLRGDPNDQAKTHESPSIKTTNPDHKKNSDNDSRTGTTERERHVQDKDVKMDIDDVGEPFGDMHNMEAENIVNIMVERELVKWNAEGKPEDSCHRIWQHYETLTQKLSFSLCEQLRLILEPTKATRLMGDFRTGKRLNMKKVLPYIASNYTKDKIWLRRVRPSQREYQILIALDDSRSMSESHSVHLAFQTLALVSKALTRLEAGDIAIASFGETAEIIHGYEDGPFTDESGVKIMKSFTFSQTATNVRALLESTMDILSKARERRSSAANLWQLEIIISDGICHDHEELHAILRKAEEDHILVLFIIIDSHDEAKPGNYASTGHKPNSILNMSQATYKSVQGRLELQMKSYMDSFPFEYFVIIRDVETLPTVLSDTLRQFFERISTT